MIVFFFSFVSSIFAITPEEVVGSSFKHYPQVIESVQSLEEKRNLEREALGSFDVKLKGEVDSRTTGYYNGDFYKAQIEKPFAFLNSSLYGGQRQGFGSFPDYEGKMDTFDQGEVFAGFSVSLLRNSLIDMNRYNLRFREQDVVQGKLELQQTKINVQSMALKAYWTWWVKGEEVLIYKNILNLAQERMRQISKRIKVGDLARIYESENMQYIRKWEALYVQSQIEFKEASYYLSLFYRDSSGKPILPDDTSRKEISEHQLTSVGDLQSVLSKAIESNLDLKNLESRMQQARLDYRLGQNELLPKVDLNFEWNQDQGVGPDRSLAQDENRIMLSIEVPLQYRKGLGKKASAQAKIDQIKTKTQWTREKLNATLRAMVFKANNLIEIYKLTLDQVKLSLLLAKAERRKFSQGASDLILVNIREQNQAEAQIKNLSSLLKYHFLNADLLQAQVIPIVPL